MKLQRNRKAARAYALQYLYAQTFTGADEAVSVPMDTYDASLDKNYAQSLINGVKKEKESLDVLINQYSPKRPSNRMPQVELTILRMALWEMLMMMDKTPAPIAINEAVRLSKEFGSDGSYKFVNAILDHISKDKLEKSANQ